MKYEHFYVKRTKNERVTSMMWFRWFRLSLIIFLYVYALFYKDIYLTMLASTLFICFNLEVYLGKGIINPFINFKRFHIREYVENKLGKENAISFAEWAWGPRFQDYKLVGSDEGIDAWNKRHGQKMRLSKYDEIIVSLPKMINLWRYENGVD